jgi:TolB-like protein/Tfp pilus assembly protein PilF/predicted Ser/Thr protein kinase
MSERMVAHYRVVRQLGAGGMGEVLLAEDTRLERSVAIKLMCAELAKDSKHRRRFHSEAKAASALNHPNICIIHEVGETEDGRPFLAMEFVEGQTLDAMMQQRRLGMAEILAIGAQAADALDAAHARRIVHRDVKPANIMLDKRGQVKILDFGLAKRFAQDGLSDTRALSSALTQTGFLIGTPHYMSPEQVLGRELDHRSDIFSLGVVLYELVGGQKPFLGKTIGETINNIVNQPPTPVGLRTPIVAPELDRILGKCLEKDPKSRYATAAQLASELTRLRKEFERPSATAVTATPSPDQRTKLWQLAGKSVRHANRSAALVAGFVILFAVAALGFYLVHNVIVRVVFSILEIALLAIAAYWFLIRRTPAQRSRRGDEADFVSRRVTPPPHVASDGSGAEQKSLAVLPFANFSAEKDSDYLSDGLTEEITIALSRLPGLKVAARNSAFAFKGRNEDARQIGEALRVTMLVEGSVRKSGQQIRVTAQLINVADGYHVWSETFDRSIGDVIAVQDEIARRIAERLRTEIGAETRAAMVQRKAVNPEAHVLYLQARHAWNKRTRADIEQAIQLFRKAIDADPSYADAHAGLAASYVIVPGYAYRPAAEYLPLARGAAARALELDPTSAEAHAVLGDAAAQVGDFENALPHLRRAIELNPNYATGHQWYGEALKELNRMDEALVEFRKAEELDPLSPIIRAGIPEWYYLSGRNEEAIVEAKKAIEIFPEFPTLRKFLAQAYIRKGMYREALAEVQRVRASTPNAPARLELLSFCEARLGHEAEARRILAELEDWQKRGYDVNEEIGYAYVGLRQYDQAIDAFERFAESGILCGSTLRNPLLLDELRDHPRFRSLLSRAGLKE